MAIQRYTSFPKTPALLEHHRHIVLQSVYSTVPVHWAKTYLRIETHKFKVVLFGGVCLDFIPKASSI